MMEEMMERGRFGGGGRHMRHMMDEYGSDEDELDMEKEMMIRMIMANRGGRAMGMGMRDMGFGRPDRFSNQRKPSKPTRVNDIDAFADSD